MDFKQRRSQALKPAWTSVLILFFLFVCSHRLLAQEEFTLVGAWKVDARGTLSHASKRDRYDSLHEKTKENVKNSLARRQYIFNDDGSITIKLVRGGEEKTSFGRWAYNGSSGSLDVFLRSTTLNFMVIRQSHDRIQLKKNYDANGSVLGDLILVRSK